MFSFEFIGITFLLSCLISKFFLPYTFLNDYCNMILAILISEQNNSGWRNFDFIWLNSSKKSFRITFIVSVFSLSFFLYIWFNFQKFFFCTECVRFNCDWRFVYAWMIFFMKLFATVNADRLDCCRIFIFVEFPSQDSVRILCSLGHCLSFILDNNFINFHLNSNLIN